MEQGPGSLENMELFMMRILIIGNLGYIGPVVVKHFRSEYPHAYLAGFDIGYFIRDTTFNGKTGDTLLDIQFYGDVRNFKEETAEGFDTIIYLAAISNDPMGNVYEQPTLAINYRSAGDIAKKGKKRGVKNFIFASSCSVYGFADSTARTETSELNPLTAYAKSKVAGEEILKTLADEEFRVTCLRFATACGYSDRLRLDLVLNDFVASAMAAKKISILSDGTPWRPLIHVKDMARAMDWACRRSNGGNYLIINTGSNVWNYQVKELAEAVKQTFTNVEVEINTNAQPDKRSYKINFGLYEKLAIGYQPQVSLVDAVEELKKGLENIGFNDADFRSSNLIRLKTIQFLFDQHIINKDLELIP